MSVLPGLPKPKMMEEWDVPNPEKTSIFKKNKRKTRRARIGEVALRLRDLRREKGIRRVPDLVERADLPCNASFIYRLERADVKPWKPWHAMRLGQTIAALAVYYGVSVESIMEREV